jgi:DNA polymerase-3 subunit gamma/tau
MATKSGSTTKSGNYVVVARRYRPQTFTELIGQSHVAQALTNAINTNRVGHAYLFTGARGVGKTSAARILAKALNCQQGPTPQPCLKCSICEDIAAGEDVDVLEIDGASNRGIDEIRQLRSNVNIRPSRAKYKIYIIDEVHMLTMQAFNALLKTLEEPPEHVKFIFCTTDPEKMPITVLSRCQRFDFASVDSASIRDRLQQICAAENVTADPGALTLLARRAAGSMRDSQSLLEQLLSFCGDSLNIDDVQKLLGTADTGRVIQLAQAIAAHQADQALASVDAALRSGVDSGQLTDQLLVCFRDVAALKVGCDDELLQFARPDDVAVLREIGDACGMETTLAILQILDNTLSRMRLSTHTRTLLEIAVMRAAHLESVESLGEMLGAMKTGVWADNNENSVASKKKGEITAARASALPPQTEVAPLSSASVSLEPPTDESLPTGESPSAAESPTAESPTAESPTTASITSPTAAPVAMQIDERPHAQVSNVASAKRGKPATQLPVDQPPLGQPAIIQPARKRVSVTTENAVRVWNQVLEESSDLVGELATDFARSYRSLAVSGGNQLVVTLASAYNKDECERASRKPQFERVLSEIAGQSMKIQFRVDQKQAAARNSLPAKNKRQIFRDAEQHPMIAEAISIFDAEIVEVQLPRDPE